MSYDMTLFLFKIFKEGVVAQWLARRGFDRKVGAFLRHKVFSTLLLYTQLYKNGLYPVDKARDTKVI